MDDDTQQFISAFAQGDVESCKKMLASHSEWMQDHGYQAHPLLSAFVLQNQGQCYRADHLEIADLLIPSDVLDFRRSVLQDNLQDVVNQLESRPNLIHSRFTAGRGIAQAIHHWPSIEIGKLLLDAGADIESLTTLGETPLTIQLRFGSVEGVKFLLEQGANPNRGEKGFMPSESMQERVELMLSHGWDINNGELLHDANHGHGKRVQIWLKYGADANVANSEGKTALHLLAIKGVGREAIHALVDAGAKLDSQDNQGNRPLDYARIAPRKSALRELLSLGADNS